MRKIPSVALFARAAAVAGLVSALILPTAAGAATTLSTTGIVTDAFTANGNVNFDDASADVILIGQNGATPDTVTIAGDVSIADSQWGITAAGAGTFATVNGLTLVANTDGFGISGGGTSRTLTVVGGGITLTATGATNVTLPTSGTLATLAGTETLANKTLTSPKIASVLDANGNAILDLSPLAAAVNRVQVSNANTGFPVALSAVGSDADVSMFVLPKGNGEVIVSNGATNADQLALKAQVAVTDAGFKGTLTSANLSAARTWTLPDASGNVVVTSGALSVASGKTLTASNTLTLAGTDGTTMTFPSSSDTLVGANATQTLLNKTVGADLAVNGTTLTLDADNAAAGANVSIVANQGSSADGVLRFNASSAKWQASSDGGTTFSDLSLGSGALTASGSPSTGHIAYWSSGSQLTGDAGLQYDSGLKYLGVGGSPTSTISASTTTAATSNSVNLLSLTHRSSGTPATGYGTGILFAADNASNAVQSLGTIQAEYTNAGAGAEATQFKFFTRNNGASSSPQFVISGTGAYSIGSFAVLGSTSIGDAAADTITFNASTASILDHLSFDGGTLYVDAVSHHVGIGETSPAALLTVGTSDAFQVDVNGNVATTGSLTLGSGGTSITKHISVSQAVAGAISVGAQSCVTIGGVTVTGAAVGDTVIATPTAVAGGVETQSVSWNAFVSAADSVSIRACNPTGSTITTGDQTWRIDLWKH